MKPADKGPRKMRRVSAMGRHSNPLFEADGCIRSNIRTHLFEVTLVADCGHTKVAAGVLWVSAETAVSARHYVETFLRIPQTHISEVKLFCHEEASDEHRSAAGGA